jgi:hypothetical protein
MNEFGGVKCEGRKTEKFGSQKGREEEGGSFKVWKDWARNELD